ncbi:MAG: hypothetical protein ABL876_05015 [Chitinophagaceae bacterium]
MGKDFASLIITNEISKSVNAAKQDNYSGNIKENGIASAVLTYRPFKFGEVVIEDPTMHGYRKFFYNKDGRVVKKFEFDTNGDIVAKEESIYDTTDKWKILQNTITTADDLFVENYEYIVLKGKTKLQQYSFFNTKWDKPKVDLYEHDNLGRICKKTSYGLLGEPELVTHYLYDSDKDTKVTYRYVTDPDEMQARTILYVYDSQKQKQTGLYSFQKTPEEITKLRQSRKKDWDMESISRSLWEYDANGNVVSLYSDVKFSPEAEILIDPQQISMVTTNRVITEKTTSEYEYDRKSKKHFLAREIEWLTRMNEPLRAVKEFRYYDEKGNNIFQPASSVAGE